MPTTARPRSRPQAALTAAAGLLAVGLAGSLLTPSGWSAQAAPGAAPAVARGDATPGYSVRALKVRTLVGPKEDHPCTVVADLYTPDGVDRDNRAPAILTTHGFGGAKDDANQVAASSGFAKAGYVVLSYSGLGFGGSDCRIHLDRPDWDGLAGVQLLDVLAGDKAARTENGDKFFIRTVANESPGDPRVGMIGGSYGGQVQYAIAGQDRRLDALIPLITWNDLAYSLAPNNTSNREGQVRYRTPGVFKQQWSGFFFGVGIQDGIAGATVDPDRDRGCPNFAREACLAMGQLTADGYPSEETKELAGEASVSTYADQVRAPTLIVQGQKDTLFNLQEAVATYRQLRQAGTKARMVWQSWGHSDGGMPAPGELDLSGDSLRDSFLGNRFLDWMNHYVRGRADAPVGPQFAYFRSWIDYDTDPGDAATAIRDAYVNRDRLGTEPTERLFLSGSDALVTQRGQVDSGSASYANTPGAATSYSETSALEGVAVNNPPSDGPGTFASWTTSPLQDKAVLVGGPELTVRLDAPVAAQSQETGPAGKLVLFAKIYDIAPGGKIRLKNRLISPVRVTDVNQPLHVRLPAVVQRVPAGHKLQLVIAASDTAYSGNGEVQPVTVRTGPGNPSVLRLPLTSGSLNLR